MTEVSTPASGRRTALLEIRHDGELHRVAVDRQRLVIGRHRDCDVVLDSEAVSRRHAAVVGGGGGHRVEDLGSRNGTLLNGARITGPTPLRDGDRIEVCDWVLTFRTAGEEALHVTLVEGAAGPSRVLSTFGVGDPGRCAVDAEAALQAVLRVTREIGSNLELAELLPRVLDAILELYPVADQGVVLLLDASGEPVPAAVRTRGGAPAEVRVSRTVLQQAVRRRQALLSVDPAADDQFAGSQSLMQMPIQSLMCVPMLGRDDAPVGAIVLHGLGSGAQFTEQCLDVLVSVAHAAGVAVENARLHEELLQRDRWERDLRWARDVQRSFLPGDLPAVPGYGFAVHYEAAQVVGGDYYGFVQRGDGRLAIAVADVSGKGMAAALMMARLSAEARASAIQYADPAAALVDLDRALSAAGPEDRFVTFLLMVLDPERHRLAVASAGHPPPLLRLADGRVEPIRATRTGLPLNVSIDPDQAPTTTVIELPPGALVVAYTDGLTETEGSAGGYGEANVRRVLAAVTGGPQDAVDQLIADSADFAAGRPRRDDTTVVALGRIGGGRGGA